MNLLPGITSGIDSKLVSFDDLRFLLFTLLQYEGEAFKVKITCGESLFSKIENDIELKKILPLCYCADFDLISIPKESSLNQEDVIAQYDQLYAQIDEAYHHLNFPKFEGQSFSAFAHDFVAKKKSVTSPPLFNEWFLDLNDYQHKKMLLLEALAWYQKLDQDKKMYTNAHLDLSHLANTSIDTLVSFESTLLHVKHSYLETLTTYRNKLDHSFRSNFKHYSASLDDLILGLSILKKDKSVDICDKPIAFLDKESSKKIKQKYKTIVDTAHSLIDSITPQYDLKFALQKSPSLNELTAGLATLKRKMIFWNESSRTILQNRVDRLSYLNLDLPELKLAWHQVTDIIHKINTAKWLSKSIDVTTNLVVNQLQIVEDTLIKIKAGINLLQSENIIDEYNEFKNSLSAKDQLFLNLFQDIPSQDWVSVFEDYYHRLLLASLRHPLTVCNNHDAKTLYKLHQHAMSVKWHDLYQKIYHKEIASKIDKLLKNKKTRPVIKAQKVEMQWLKQDTDLHTAIVDLFPLELSINTMYTNELVVDVKEESGDRQFNFILENDKLESLHTIVKTMRATSYADRFKVAKDLTTCLELYASNVEILQLKNANVITNLPSQVFNLLFQDLKSFGVKKLQIKSRQSDAILESILECERAQYLILADGLIDFNKPLDLIKQYQIMEAFERVGYTILNVWTCDLVEDANNTIGKIVDILVKE